ncbi:MAG TPA: YdcF family protein [Flavipsychrobacter sp.]|nr:YdcF family protein [Flavipsychrobacter sp.]
MQSRLPINSFVTLILLVVILAFYLMMSSCRSVGTFLGSGADKSAARQFARVKNYTPVDVLIIPGIPFENGEWEQVMKGRVIWSWILYKNGYVKNVIYSGDAVYSPYKEAIIMGLYAQQLGIPKEHIFYETQARHSTENVYYSYLLAQKKGFKTIALGTDPYFQSPLLKSFTKRRFETYIHHIPFVRDSLKAYEQLNPVIDPTPAKVNDFSSIMHQENFRTRLKGTLGKDIDWKQYKDGRVGAL